MCKFVLTQCFLCAEPQESEEYPCGDPSCLRKGNIHEQDLCEDCAAKYRIVDADPKRRRELLAKLKQREAEVLEKICLEAEEEAARLEQRQTQQQDQMHGQREQETAHANSQQSDDPQFSGALSRLNRIRQENLLHGSGQAQFLRTAVARQADWAIWDDQMVQLQQEQRQQD
ncbi:MAG: hypothetical protein MMC33_009105 [Icmadophila ericetorum]|nr:hypothetical protein [Icmadophila ericetorum]